MLKYFLLFVGTFSLVRSEIRGNPECPVGDEHSTIHESIDHDRFCETAQSDGEKVLATTTITVTELKAKIDRKDPFVLLDVREPFEYDICKINGSRLIPLGELPSRLSELDSADEIVLLCKSGTRSAKAFKILQEAGFQKLANLRGGILGWADTIDPSLPKY